MYIARKLQCLKNSRQCIGTYTTVGAPKGANYFRTDSPCALFKL